MSVRPVDKGARKALPSEYLLEPGGGGGGCWVVGCGDLLRQGWWSSSRSAGAGWIGRRRRRARWMRVHKKDTVVRIFCPIRAAVGCWIVGCGDLRRRGCRSSSRSAGGGVGMGRRRRRLARCGRGREKHAVVRIFRLSRAVWVVGLSGVGICGVGDAVVLQGRLAVGWGWAVVVGGSPGVDGGCEKGAVVRIFRLSRAVWVVGLSGVGICCAGDGVVLQGRLRAGWGGPSAAGRIGGRAQKGPAARNWVAGPMGVSCAAFCAVRTAGCRRGGSSLPRRGCRCGRRRRTRRRCRCGP